MTTLDDLTPQERANLVGTWITVTHNPRPLALALLAHAERMGL
jgi:hypothetical protein